ncbi:MAG: DUF2029 domain-containing protein [Gemmataceae bacterium]|nr:DUF2029 domain-containing protein [Gemmataceae bacterium]
MDVTTSSTPAFTASRQRWFVAGLALLAVGLSVQYCFKILDDGRDDRSAILRWREQIGAVDDGINIWDVHNYPNPPIMMLLLEPLAELPPLLGALGWFYLKVGMAALSIWMAFRLCETPDRPFPAWGKAVAILLSLRPIMGDLSHGNVNLFILLLVIGALYAYRQRREYLSGGLLALGIACKVTPALFVPYFLWKRSWRALGGCAIGLVLFFWLVPGLLLGMDRNADYLGAWVDRMVVPFVVRGEVWSEHNNQALPGLAARLLTDSPSFSKYVGNDKQALEYHNVARLDPELVRWGLKAVMGLFALVVVWTCRTPTTERTGWRMAAEFSLILLGMLLFSERTWKHHCVTLLLPFAVIVYYLSACRPGPGLRRYLIATLVLVVVLMTTTSTGVLPGTRWMGKIAQVYGAYAWAHLLLVAALAMLLRTEERTTETQS